MKSNRKKNQAGFSLVELMVVVAIIGVLAALAVPRFQMFQAKARQSEVKNNLSHIYTLEQSYHGDNDIFAPFASQTTAVGRLANKTQNCGATTSNPIGFALTDCSKVRYGYWVSNASATDFTGNGITGTGANNMVVPKSTCTTADNWTIDSNKTITTVSNSVSSCM